MTSRDSSKGAESIKTIKTRNPNQIIECEPLDMSCRSSIDQFCDVIGQTYGKLDVLVNNAGIFLNEPQTKSVIEKTINVNFLNVKYLTERMLEKDLISDEGKIINVSTEFAKFYFLKELNPALYNELRRYKDDSVFDLDHYINLYLSQERMPWQEDVYNTSKMFLSIWTYLLAKRDSHVISNSIQCYSFCPGFCDTDMNAEIKAAGRTPYYTAEQGGLRAVDLIEKPFCLEPSQQGQFFALSKIDDLDGHFEF